MCLQVKRIVNSPINSNCFVLYLVDKQACIIVDPGTADCEELKLFLDLNDLYPVYVILTHEHFDHILGLNRLRSQYDFITISTQLCSERMKDSKKNLSVFQDQVGFECDAADLLIENRSQLPWDQYNLRFLHTPGHTSSSLCFEINEKLFVGDLIINGVKTVTKLPTGNKLEVVRSINVLKECFGDEMEVFSGHGDNFLLKEVDVKSIV